MILKAELLAFGKPSIPIFQEKLGLFVINDREKNETRINFADGTFRAKIIIVSEVVANYIKKIAATATQEEKSNFPIILVPNTNDKYVVKNKNGNIIEQLNFI